MEKEKKKKIERKPGRGKERKRRERETKATGLLAEEERRKEEEVRLGNDIIFQRIFQPSPATVYQKLKPLTFFRLSMKG